MTAFGPILEDFGGEPRSFRVLVGELEQIQARCKAGPGEVAHRLARAVAVIQRVSAEAREARRKPTILEFAAAGLGPLHPEDIRSPIFCGLTGDGMAPNDAGRLVREWIDDRGFLGLIENVALAFQLVVAGYSEPKDPDDEDPGAGELSAGRTTATTPAS